MKILTHSDNSKLRHIRLYFWYHPIYIVRGITSSLSKWIGYYQFFIYSLLYKIFFHYLCLIVIIHIYSTTYDNLCDKSLIIEFFPCIKASFKTRWRSSIGVNSISVDYSITLQIFIDFQRQSRINKQEKKEKNSARIKFLRIFSFILLFSKFFNSYIIILHIL